MDRYVRIKNYQFRLCAINHLKNGTYLISFWVNEGTIHQDLLTLTVDDVIKTEYTDREIYKVVSKLKPDFWNVYQRS